MKLQMPVWNPLAWVILVQALVHSTTGFQRNASLECVQALKDTVGSVTGIDCYTSMLNGSIREMVVSMNVCTFDEFGLAVVAACDLDQNDLAMTTNTSNTGDNVTMSPSDGAGVVNNTFNLSDRFSFDEGSGENDDASKDDGVQRVQSQQETDKDKKSPKANCAVLGYEGIGSLLSFALIVMSLA